MEKKPLSKLLPEDTIQWGKNENWEDIFWENENLMVTQRVREEWNQVYDTMEAPVIPTEKPQHYWNKCKVTLLFTVEENKRSYGLQENFSFSEDVMQCYTELNISFKIQTWKKLLFTAHKL